MDAKQLLAEALRLSDEERAALAGELIQSLEREVDADAEAAWPRRFARGSSAWIPDPPPRSHGQRRAAAFTQLPVVARELEYLEEALEEAVAATRWYAERSATAAARSVTKSRQPNFPDPSLRLPASRIKPSS
jgi:hypothetical protein